MKIFLIIVVIYLIMWLLTSYVSYQIGFMEKWCKEDPWDEPTPVSFLVMLLYAWWVFIIIIPFIILFKKINDYFYDKWKK